MAELRANYFANLDDDFNTGGAVGVMFEMLALLRKYIFDRKLETEAGRDPADVGALRDGTAVLREFGSILGLFWQRPPAEAAPQLAGGAVVDGLMAILLSVREKLRATAKSAAKDNPLKKPLFDATDDIRKELAKLNIALEDQPGGTKWSVAPTSLPAG